jgi:hypothetical protein
MPFGGKDDGSDDDDDYGFWFRSYK